MSTTLVFECILWHNFETRMIQFVWTITEIQLSAVPLANKLLISRWKYAPIAILCASLVVVLFVSKKYSAELLLFS